jgi:preprotein translocase subunit SecG
MNIAFYVVLVLHVIACLFLIGVVLLQQGKGQDLASAFGGGVTQTAFGPRGSANILSRATTVLAGLFMVSSMTLSMLRPSSSSVLEQMPAAAAPANAPAPAPAPGANPAAPADSAASPDAAAPQSAAPASSAPPSSAPAENPRPLTEKDVGPNAK